MPLSKQIISRTLSSPQGERAYKIVETLSDKGYDTWWVGGCVRDMLMGKIPDDIDIATSAKPEDVTALFKRSSGQAAMLGSARVTLGDMTFEITTFREDDEASDGRHPESIRYGTLAQDAMRRDFTVNAMYWNPLSQELWDPFNGEDDLKEKLIRFIGDAAIRIRHDALRMLRAVRLRATLEGQYHPETYRALEEQAGLVEILSGMRLQEEMEKMLLCPHPDRAFSDLRDLGILAHFLLELAACKGIPQPADYHREGDVWEHEMRCIAHFRPEDTIDARVAVLLHDIGKAQTFALTGSTRSPQDTRIRFDHHATVSAELATKAFSRLQYAAKRSGKICWLIAHHMSMTFLDMPEERKPHWYFHPWFSELLQVFYLDIAGTEPPDFSLYQKIVKDYEHFLDAHPRPAKPLLSGNDVMEILGVAPGAKVGEILQQLHDAQTRGEITGKAEAREYVKKFA